MATTSKRLLWAAWLVVVASAPDVDCLVPALRLPGPVVIRVIHSILGCQVVPLLTCLALWLIGLRGREFAIRCLQASTAGLSHIVLDLLVGVTLAALLWPFSSQTYRLPFGVLPSAGGLRWNNGFLIRNLLIEVGVLLPVFVIVWKRRSSRWTGVTALAAVSCACMMIAHGLRR